MEEVATGSKEPTHEEEEQAPSTEPTPPPPPNHAWQAIFSPQHNAYYFYNAETQETTWVNPLQGPETASTSASTSTPASSSTPPAASTPAAEPASESKSTSPEPSTSTTTPALSHYAALQAAAEAQGIDPALAHLDPSLLSAIPGQQTDASGIPLFTAKFNRHTGAFAKKDARDPSHLSEHERAKRMSEFYFDVGKWEEDLARYGGSIRASNPASGSGSYTTGAAGGAGAGEEWEDDGQGGRKRKRPSKKELNMFKEKKKQKKLAKTAWLRN